MSKLFALIDRKLMFEFALHQVELKDILNPITCS